MWKMCGLYLLLLNEQRRRLESVDCRTDPLLHQRYPPPDPGLITVADDNEDDQTIYTALSIAYEYLVSATRRKITWSLSLEKLAVHCHSLSMNSSTLPSKPTYMHLSKTSSNPIELSPRDNTRNPLNVSSTITVTKNYNTSSKKKSRKKTYLSSGPSPTSTQKSPLLKSFSKAWTQRKSNAKCTFAASSRSCGRGTSRLSRLLESIKNYKTSIWILSKRYSILSTGTIEYRNSRVSAAV